MPFSFDTTPHKEAAALLAGKPVVSAQVFKQLLPELRARAFTVSGIESANLLQSIKDEVAALPEGAKWDDSKQNIADALEPYLGEEGSQIRAETILRVNGFQAYQASTWRTAQEDPETEALQYLHGDCQVPTPEHLALNGVILPKTDPFWDDHFGPWGHLGCVCYTRTMSTGQVDRERAKDDDRNPEDKLVLEGPSRDRLVNQSKIIRGTTDHDVSIPEDGFKWHPDDLRIPMGYLKQRYDPEVWAQFEAAAKTTMISPDTTLWNYLMSHPSDLTQEHLNRITARTIRQTAPPT